MRCKGCQTVVGWTYLKAWEGSQKYKEGEYGCIALRERRRGRPLYDRTEDSRAPAPASLLFAPMCRSLHHGAFCPPQGQQLVLKPLSPH